MRVRDGRPARARGASRRRRGGAGFELRKVAGAHAHTHALFFLSPLFRVRAGKRGSKTRAIKKKPKPEPHRSIPEWEGSHPVSITLRPPQQTLPPQVHPQHSGRKPRAHPSFFFRAGKRGSKTRARETKTPKPKPIRGIPEWEWSHLVQLGASPHQHPLPPRVCRHPSGVSPTARRSKKARDIQHGHPGTSRVDTRFN